MSDDLIEFEGGDILANLEERTITGLLLPYGEEGRTNVGRFAVDPGTVALPSDPMVVGINTDHDRPATVGRAIRVEETPAGVLATFQFANTPEGDAALADAVSPTGRRRKLSAEFGPAVIKAGRLVAGHAKLWGAALVEAGAFPSAQVLAADTPDAPEITIDVEALPEAITALTPAGESATYTPEAAPAEVNPEGESIVTATIAGATTPAPVTPPTAQVLATVPSSLILPNANPVETVDRAVADKRQVFAAINTLRANPRDAGALEVLAALVDIKVSGTNALPAAGVLQPDWVGQVNQGVAYDRQYITLGKLGTDISIEGKKGFKAKRGTAAAPLDKFDGTWAGNKAAVNSYNGFTQTVASSRRNFAIAEDIAREFYDLPGGAEVVEAFIALIVEDYYRQSDDWALADWITAAGAPVAPGTYPTDYPGALGMLIQGILAVKRRKADGRRDVPTFAIANELAFTELAFAAGGDQNLPAFVDINVSTNGDGVVDGKVRVVEGDTGIDDTKSVIVGADYAIEFDELPGGPLTLDALDIAKGGIDKAVHGYVQTFIARPEAVVLIGTADTP